MTMLVSAVGVVGRIAGDLLTSALAWASSLLFGRVPKSHQRYLILMMAASLLWIVTLVSLLIPRIAGLLLSTTPHPALINTWLVLGLALAVVAPATGRSACAAISCQRKVSVRRDSPSSWNCSAATSWRL